MDLLLDSPAAVRLEVARAVKRWRWRNVEAKMPQLTKEAVGQGALMEPITKLLKSKSNNEEWNPALGQAVPTSKGLRGRMGDT